MSGFWSKALGGPPAPAPPVAAVTSASPWWDPTPAPPQVPHIPRPETVVVPTPSKAVSARSSITCPDCGSGNYFQPASMPNAMTQCYECGYNPRFAHSTAGAGMPSDSNAPARPARQISTANNYNPGQIVGRIE